MHHYIQDSSILTLSYPGSWIAQLWSKLEDIAIIIIILSPGCQQPFLVKMASDNRLSAAVFGPKWLVTTGCQQPLPKIYYDTVNMPKFNPFAPRTVFGYSECNRVKGGPQNSPNFAHSQKKMLWQLIWIPSGFEKKRIYEDNFGIIFLFPP